MRKQWAPSLPCTAPAPVVSQTHYEDDDWDLVDGEFLRLPFQSPPSFAC